MSPDDVFYSWSAHDRGGRGAGGVTLQPDRATQLLSNAISELAPGATGTIRPARIDRQAWPSAYVYGPTLVRARRCDGVTVLECADAR